MSSESFGEEEEEEEEEESDLEGTAPTPKGRKLARDKALTMRVVKHLVRPFVGLNHVIYCDNFYSSSPLVDLLSKDSIFLIGTIEKCARGFPLSLKGVKPPKGNYVSDRVDDMRYFVFQDHREVCFVTNVFPEYMDSQVARLQPEGVLRNQSVPPLLPAYNMFMDGVDRTDQLRKRMAVWLRLFFQFFDYAINNAHKLYITGAEREKEGGGCGGEIEKGCGGEREGPAWRRRTAGRAR